jgi:tRNA(fMet)-specific endonuclease VapC
MSFLLDTNICSAHIRKPTGLAHRFLQYSGRFHIPTIVLGELYAWGYRRSNPSFLINIIDEEFLEDFIILPFDLACAFEFGKIKGAFIQKGISIETADMTIAATALVHDLTLVTHNTADFRNIPNLRLEDWLIA